MSLTVFNTMGGRKEPFVPGTPGKVRMYVCGVTVYDLCHIGHARANVAFDIIVRYLRHAGYEVRYVRNFTDIDDKIIRKANQEGIPFTAVTKNPLLPITTFPHPGQYVWFPGCPGTFPT